MRYDKMVSGRFVDRPNRFIAHVEIAGRVETVHVKNTGRCRELLLPQAAVRLSESSNPNRKTKYDLVMVYKESVGWINMDSQAPNQVMGEWLADLDDCLVRPEYSFGGSRLDFYLQIGEERYLIEVKGCTLEKDGVGYFPDAPTQRGARHLRELTGAVAQGYHAVIAFVIQMEGVEQVFPYAEMDPAFAAAFREAVESGVEVWLMCCSVGEDSLQIRRRIVPQPSVYLPEKTSV